MPTATVQQAFELALQHHQAGRLGDAETLYRQILAMQPKHADALHLLGVVAHQSGRHDLAVTWIHQAIDLSPGNDHAHSNLGEVYYTTGRLDDAIASYQRAIELNPGFAVAHYNLGNALARRGQTEEAILAYRRAIQLQPDFPRAYYNWGNALRERGLLDEAIAAYRRALELQPDYVEAENNLGNAFKEQGRVEEAIAAYRRGLAANPQHAGLRSNVIYALHFHPGGDTRMIFEAQRQWNQQIGAPLQRGLWPYANDRSPDRRLRIGYVSPDFRDHVIGRNLLPLFQGHNHRQFEILIYAGVVRADGLTEEFRRCSDQWRNTIGVADEVLTEMIRQDGVDLLVDLTQHMGDNRLPVFARQPAPVQVSFAGYPESTGLEAIGYRISDRWLEGGSAGEAIGRQEQVCLLDSFWCYQPHGVPVAVQGLPARENGWVTFGNLNNFAKVNEPVLELWARVLGQVAASRLVLLSALGSHRQRTLEFLAGHGVEAHRVEFVEPRAHAAYLELYQRLDIVLDPFPYNGHTTSLDALWMGVPVVSLAGRTRVSRGGLSILNNLGLPELVAFTEGDYLSIATELAHDLPRLATLRATLRPRMEASVLMDAPRFARQIEAAYRTMWRQWCARL
jgi:predicted O-linked N-acetylglucosamine transferase (SPINDLY family)